MVIVSMAVVFSRPGQTGHRRPPSVPDWDGQATSGTIWTGMDFLVGDGHFVDGCCVFQTRTDRSPSATVSPGPGWAGNSQDYVYWYGFSCGLWSFCRWLLYFPDQDGQVTVSPGLGWAGNSQDYVYWYGLSCGLWSFCRWLLCFPD
jgi:hypothetical protein